MASSTPWHISNFKGIKSAEIDLRSGKSTLITGINSSGKSSIIQSLLLFTQSVQNENELVLNGPLVRLGEASSLVREGADPGSIEISLKIDRAVPEDHPEDRNLLANFALASSDELSTMRSSQLFINNPSDENYTMKASRLNSRRKDEELAMRATERLGPRTALHLKSLLGTTSRPLRTFVIMQGLMPIAVVKLMSEEEIGKRYRAAINELFGSSDSLQSSPAIRTHAGIPSSIREFIGLITASAPSGDDANFLTAKFDRVRSGNPYSFEKVWSALKKEEREFLIDLAAFARQKNPYILLSLGSSRWRYGYATGLLEGHLIEGISDTYDALFSLGFTLSDIATRIQYLGPLRDEPRVVWNHWNELARGLPVGTRGEYSAAVLSRAGNSTIRYTSPDHAPKVDTLTNAVSEWLSYLEIGQTVSARSHGKLGVGLDLRVNNQLRDLTAVGVGVSQALPFVVGLLAVPRGSIFAVEQPELHLHPAAQSRIADFILFARPDVSIIIETHSEAIITRVRRRAAENRINRSDVDIIFVEPEEDGSSTRSLEVSEFGDLSEWPAGFVSNSEEDVRAILSAGLNRASD